MRHAEIELTRTKARGRRGLSGVGVLLVIVGLVVLGVTYSVLPPGSTSSGLSS